MFRRLSVSPARFASLALLVVALAAPASAAPALHGPVVAQDAHWVVGTADSGRYLCAKPTPRQSVRVGHAATWPATDCVSIPRGAQVSPKIAYGRSPIWPGGDRPAVWARLAHALVLSGGYLLVVPLGVPHGAYSPAWRLPLSSFALLSLSVRLAAAVAQYGGPTVANPRLASAMLSIVPH
jgi:hypothetical protein